VADVLTTNQTIDNGAIRIKILSSRDYKLRFFCKQRMPHSRVDAATDRKSLFLVRIHHSRRALAITSPLLTKPYGGWETK
jgi:hypothetical protein